MYLQLLATSTCMAIFIGIISNAKSEVPGEDAIIGMDDQGRMHIDNENDVFLAGINVRELYNTVVMLNSSNNQGNLAQQDLVTTVQELRASFERTRTTNQQQLAQVRAIQKQLGHFDVSSARLQKLVAADGSKDAHFGNDLAVTDRTVMVGANWDDEKSGSVYVFEKNSTGAYVQVDKLVVNDGTEEFGRAVAVSDHLLVVGASNAIQGRLGKGAAYVFDKSARTGKFVYARELGDAASLANGAEFGWDVCVTDNMIVVGTGGGATATSGAYVYS
eukprot:m.22315 g.22315  ORF g.22315 m.22315 type:complete len:275 (+) comp11230_c0_seq2:180-1004(+)